jgi:hypothetical protein
VSESTADVTAVAEEKHTKEIRIIVNGVPNIVEADTVSYEQVVKLAYPAPPSPNTYFTVTFRNAEGRKEGSLAPGQTVQVKREGTIFNVTSTGKS